MTTILLIGSTGLVGQSVLTQALADSRVEKIVALTRKPLDASLLGNPRLENPVVDFDALPASAPWWKVDALISTLGTTMRQAGSQPAFLKVDLKYPTAVAKLARANGAATCALCSSVGAGPAAKSFYLRTKTEVENVLIKYAFPSLTILRPSIIDGERQQSRPLESIALKLMRVARPLTPPRYRPIAATRIATALLNAAITATPGTHILESEQI